MDLRQATIYTQASTRMAVLSSDAAKKIFAKSDKMQTLASLSILANAMAAICEDNGMSYQEVFRSFADNLNQMEV